MTEAETKSLVDGMLKAHDDAKPKPKETTPVVIEGAAGIGVFDRLPDIKVFGIPAMDAAKGLAVLGVSDALVGVVRGLVPVALPSWAVKGTMVVILGWKPIRNALGQGATNVGQLLLTADAVQELVNVRGSVSNVLSGITGGFVKRSPPVLTGAGRQPVPAGGNRGDLYGRIF